MCHFSRIKIAALYACIVALLPACAAITTKIPIAQLESPETRGEKGKFGFVGALHGASDSVLVSSTTITPPPLQVSDINPGTVLSAGGTYAVHERVDLGLRLLSTGLIKLSAKFQALGAVGKEPEAGFVLTPFASIGGYKIDNKDSAVFSTLTAESSAGLFSTDLGLLAGYRANPMLLVYGNLWYSTIQYDGTITQFLGATESGRYSFSGSVRQFSGGLGLQIGSGALKALLEAARSNTVAGSLRAADWRTGVGLTLGLP